MNFKKDICLLMLILFFISLSFVSASDNNQTIGMIDNEELSTSPATFTDFSDEIQKAGDTINLKTDYTYNSDFNKNGIVINKSMTIEGNGKTFDGNNNARIFNITADNVVINNVNFINGFVKSSGEKPNSGAAIHCTGSNLIINNCTFINNNGGNNGGGDDEGTPEATPTATATATPTEEEHKASELDLTEIKKNEVFSTIRCVTAYFVVFVILLLYILSEPTRKVSTARSSSRAYSVTSHNKSYEEYIQELNERRRARVRNEKEIAREKFIDKYERKTPIDYVTNFAKQNFTSGKSKKRRKPRI